MSAYRVGLTGGLASGKSTVARQLALAGLTVVDADHLVADLYRPGGAGARAVAELFGPGLIAADGGVDKRALARRVFADSQARSRLEAAIHPLVREAFAAIARRSTGVAVLEATLLVEAGYAPDFDFVITVEAPEEERLRRAVRRGLAEADARTRLAAQGGGEARRAAAHLVLLNDGDRRALRRQVARLAEDLKQRAAAGTS